MSLMTYTKDILKMLFLKDLEIQKCTCEIFYFDYQMWKYYIKGEISPSKANKKVNIYIKKFLVS